MVSFYTHEGPGTGGSATDNVYVTYLNENGQLTTLDTSSASFISYSSHVKFHAHPTGDDFDPWEDDILEYEVRFSPMFQSLCGQGFRGSVHLGNNTPDAVLEYDLNLLLPAISKASNNPSLNNEEINKEIIDNAEYMPSGGFFENMFINLMIDYQKYMLMRQQAFSNNGAFGWLTPQNLYLGPQYYGEKIGEEIGGYWGGKAGRFFGDLIGLVGGGVVGLIEGVGFSIGYAAATGDILAPLYEGYNLGKSFLSPIIEAPSMAYMIGEKTINSVMSGKNQFTDEDINKIIDWGTAFGLTVIPTAKASGVRVRDISIARYDSLGANPKISKVKYGYALYFRDKPIIGISQGKIVTDGVPAPKNVLEPGKAYVAIDKYQIPHFKKTLESLGIDTTRVDSGLNIANTVYQHGEGIFKPKTYEIYSENIPEPAKPAVINAMKRYVKEGHGEIEVYGSNVQKMQIGDYQTRPVKDIEIAVNDPKTFVRILDEELQKHGIRDYIIGNPESECPKVYFGGLKGIEIFKHDTTIMGRLKDALKRSNFEADIDYGFKSLKPEKIGEFNAMPLPEQTTRKFGGGHVLRQTENGSWEILPKHEGRYKDITDFVDIAVAYYNEKGIISASDIINYVKSTPDYIAEKVTSPTFHYIRQYGRIPTLEEIKSFTQNKMKINDVGLNSAKTFSDVTKIVENNIMRNDKIIKNVEGFNDITFRNDREFLFRITKEDVSTSLKIRNKIKDFMEYPSLAIEYSPSMALSSISISIPKIRTNINISPSINKNNDKNKNNTFSTSLSTTTSTKTSTSISTSISIPPSIPPSTPPSFPPSPPIKPPSQPPSQPPSPPSQPPSPPSQPPSPPLVPPSISIPPSIPPSFPPSPPIDIPSLKDNKDKKKKEFKIPKLPIHIKKPDVKKNKRTWFLRDLLNPNKAFKDMEETVAKSIKNININIKI